MYSDYLKVNKNFQSAINLELDLNNEQKINEYIPTSDICDVLKKYVKSALGITKDKSTLLVGPYGKGKSFLLLILSYLFSKNKDTECYTNLLNKIKPIDEELYSLLLRVKKEDISLLPVIINSNYDNIIQSFQIALHEALNREGISGVVPKTVFDICVELIDKWEKDNNIREAIVDKCVAINKVDLKTLEKDLKGYSYDAYNQFEKLYNCVNVGLSFNPLVSDDISKLYAQTAVSLSQFGYKGIFIIFDEFSKFLESTSTNLMRDLKVLQDVAEMCSRSKEKPQLHICCVTHKPISLYKSDKKQANALESFKAVEGRFKEVRFNRSIEENYQIISAALIKNKSYDKLIKDVQKHNKNFFNDVLSLHIFDEDFARETLFKGCYPLNPLTVYFLIRISEYCAQNERTLFTFLSDSDSNSFNSFLYSSESGMFNVDKIYDYFLSTFLNDETSNIRNVCYRSESILTRLDDLNERKVIKSLAIILMINDFDKVPPIESVISCSLNLSSEDTAKAVSSLVDKGVIRKNMLNSYLSFALSSTRQIDDEFKIYNSTKFDKSKIALTLNGVNDHPYLLPRKYNENNKITRFYKNIYMTSTDFYTMADFSYYFEDNYCDGVVISLISDSLNEKEIKNKVNALKDPRVIVRYSRDSVEQVLYDSISYYECLMNLKNRKGLDELTSSDIDFLVEECTNDIHTCLTKYFSDSDFYSIYRSEVSSLSELLSLTMERCYSVTLIFNNELANKRNVTSQYQKAVNHVIDWLLDKKGDFPYSETSPESSVKVAVLDSNDISKYPDSISAKNLRQITDEIREEISKSKNKVVVSKCLDKYRVMPFGIREGILPLILASAISELSGNVILYYDKKEIELNANNLVKATSNPNYTLIYSKSSAQQDKYHKNMMKLFEVSVTNDFRKDISNLSAAIRRYFVGLPQIIRTASSSNNYLELSNEFLDYKMLFLSININPYEVIFTDPIKIFSTDNYEKIYQGISKLLEESNSCLFAYKSSLISEIKKIFKMKAGESLKSGFNHFLLTSLEGQTPILDQLDKAIYEVVSRPVSYDDEELLNVISRATTNQYVDDWNRNNSESLLSSLKGFKKSIDSCAKASSSEDAIKAVLESSNEGLSSLAKLLENNIESAIDEYSESISTEEKRAVLAEILKKYL